MGAAEDERVGLEIGVGGVPEEFVEIDADDLLGYGVVRGVFCPAFFYQRDEERAGFFDGAEAEGLAGVGVSVAANGGVCGDDESVAGTRGCAGGLRAGFDDAEDGEGTAS